MNPERIGDSDEVIAMAFDLPAEAGVDLLLRLGTLDVWRGDLATMRDDVPRHEASPQPAPAQDAVAAAERLYAGHLMRRAMEYLQPRCREALFLRYRERRDPAFIAKQLGYPPGNAEKRVQMCRDRAHEIARTLEESDSHERPGDTHAPAAHHRKATG